MQRQRLQQVGITKCVKLNIKGKFHHLLSLMLLSILYDFLCSFEHKRKCFEKCFYPHNETQWCPKTTSSVFWFGTTWRYVNRDRILITGWTFPLKWESEDGKEDETMTKRKTKRAMPCVKFWCSIVLTFTPSLPLEATCYHGIEIENESTFKST